MRENKKQFISQRYAYDPRGRHEKVSDEEYRKEYKKLVGFDQLHLKGIPVEEEKLPPQEQKENKPKVVRTCNINRDKCRERAERIWEHYPKMHPAQLAEYPAFRVQAVMKNGNEYKTETYKDWIRDLWPKEFRYNGPPTALDVPNAIIEKLLQEQRNLAQVIEDPCTSDEAMLAQIESVIAVHEPLLRRVGEHIAALRSKLPEMQRERLMDVCAEVIRGPMRQGRGQGYGRGRQMGRQDSSEAVQRGRGYGRAAGGRGYGRQRGRLARRLGLTGEQMLIIQEKDPDFEADLIRMRNTLMTEREELLNAFEDARTSNQELLEQINALVLAHSQIERRIARHLLILRPHLNAEQQKWLIGLCRHSQERS